MTPDETFAENPRFADRCEKLTAMVDQQAVRISNLIVANQRLLAQIAMHESNRRPVAIVRGLPAPFVFDDE